jgi:hypothetical protein
MNTVDVLRQRRKILEIEIAKVLAKFSEETGLTVVSIDVNHISTTRFSERSSVPAHYNINVDVRI